MTNRGKDQIIYDMLSKQQITEQLNRWTRGADRNDLDLMSSVFHPDAKIDYGFSCAPAGEFLKAVLKQHEEEFIHTTHTICSVLINLNDSSASSEAGVSVVIRYSGENGLSDFLLHGRYLDKWDYREGTWKIYDRLSTLDWYTVRPVNQDPEVDKWVNGITPGRRDKKDPSYLYVADLTR